VGSGIASLAEERAQQSRERAEIQALFRLGEPSTADRYELPAVTLSELVRTVRLTKIPVGDGRMV
jgi:hypothetical protein